MSSISEKDFYNLTVSVNKALNPMESPLKIKHARSIIIMTHRTKEAKSLWTVILRQQLLENRFTAWKFCHLLHKVLREGHFSALKQSQTHKKMILEMGKLWGHLQDGMGNCIEAYTNLLVTKLDFHEKNSYFSGAFGIEFHDVVKVIGEDISAYFQLCVEIYDYLDAILNVQLLVFGSVNTYRMSSMTPQGQCRLAPLITLVQDSNSLYDLCVRVMFKLHDGLPSDVLTGHRDRFCELFAKIKTFYENIRPLQYFADLILVPHLPDCTPNFTSKVDFGSYIPPQIVVQSDAEPIMDNLVEIKDNCTEPTSSVPNNEHLAFLESKLQEKDVEINQLNFNLYSTKLQLDTVEVNHKSEISQLRDQLSLLNIELESATLTSRNLQGTNLDLEVQLENVRAMRRKSIENAEKSKVSEEKFTKLKSLYAQLRDEHINLLRKHNEINKDLHKEISDNVRYKTEIEQIQTQKTALEEDIKIRDSKHANEKDLEVREVTSKCCLLQKTCEDMKLKYDALESFKNTEINSLTTELSKLQDQVSELELCKSEMTKLQKSLKEARDSLQFEKDNQTTTLNTCKHDLENSIINFNNLKDKYEADIGFKNNEISKLLLDVGQLETTKKKNELLITQISKEKLSAEERFMELSEQNDILDTELKTSRTEISSIFAAKNQSDSMYKKRVDSILCCVFQTLVVISEPKFTEPNQTTYVKCLIFLGEVDKCLLEFSIAMLKHPSETNIIEAESNAVEALIRTSLFMCYHFIMLYEQCVCIYNTSADFEKAKDIFREVNDLCQLFCKMFKICHLTKEKCNVETYVNTIKSALLHLKRLVEELMRTSNSTADLEDLFKSEIQEMDKAIEEAAKNIVEMLSKTRQQNSGIKLDVNEKILDACKNLIACIKYLIQKSKALQEEIVSSGGANSTASTFYKRNSQWTEGLISASKSVAKGANLLVEAANKAVCSESSQNFEIIVAAQEIAACTVQLVIASKVKAPPQSLKLDDLTKASRNVSHATGAIVATVKDCNEHLQLTDEIDVTKLTSSQAKAMEMEIHVKVIELEQALQNERLKLTTFRRNNYQNTEG